MRDGHVVQAAPPAEVYLAPADPEVARFVGEVNLLSATLRQGDPFAGDTIKRARLAFGH